MKAVTNTKSVAPLERQVASRRKARSGRESVLTTPLDKMFCDVKPDEVSRNELKLESIIQELNLLVKESKKAEKARKGKHEGLRLMAMGLMEPGSEFRTKLGVLNYRTSNVSKRFSKDLLKEELIRRGFSEKIVTEIIKASIIGIQVRDFVAFSLKKAKRK